MSRYHAIRQRPFTWVSAHRNCVFKFGLPTQMAFGGYDASGYLGIVMTSTWGGAGSPSVGDRLYIYGGTYEGFVTIREVVSSIQFVTESDWVGAMANEQIGFVTLPTISIYKGYEVGEITLGGQDLSEWQPYELVGQFKPEVGTDGMIEFDIYGYLKTVISVPVYGYNQDEENKIIEKDADEDYIPLNYNKVDVFCDDNLEATLYVANTGLSMNELNRFFVDTGQAMQPLNIPIEFNKTINTQDKITSLTQIRYGN